LSRQENFSGSDGRRRAKRNPSFASQLSLLTFAGPPAAGAVALNLHKSPLLAHSSLKLLRDNREARAESQAQAQQKGDALQSADLDRRETWDRYGQECVGPRTVSAGRAERIRSRELRRLLPRGPFEKGVDLACGEGDFSIEMTEEAFAVVGLDRSDMIVDRARTRFPQVDFRQADIKSLPEQWFESVDLVVWLAAIHALSKDESAAVLQRIACAHEARPVALLISSCIIDLDDKQISLPSVHDIAPLALTLDRGQRDALEPSNFVDRVHHGFKTPQEFLDHVRSFFPTAKGIPVELDFKLRRFCAMGVGQHAVRLSLKLLSWLGAYRAALRLVQWAMLSPSLFRLAEPLVVHFAIVVEFPYRSFPPILQQPAGRFLNNQLIARLLSRRYLFQILNRCVRGRV